VTTLIIYTHGALSTNNSWNYIRGKLKEKHGEVDPPLDMFFKYSLNLETADDIITKMAEKIKAAVKKHGVKKLVLAGHSFGGVLSVGAIRLLSEFLAEQGVKAHAVTLSTPFAGSEMVAVLKLFKPKSTFFANIGSSDSFIRKFKALPLPCSTHSFITTEGGAEWMPQANDGVVTVESQTYYKDDPKATLQEVKANHFEILLADAVVNKLHALTR